jgi:hypothetical protein
MAEAENPNPNAVKDRKFGELNDVSRPQIRKRFNGDDGQTFSAIARATVDAYTPDGLANFGQFKGVVLRIDVGPGVEQTTNERGGWLESFFGDSATEEVAEFGGLVEIKVRVPEVHSMLPLPDTIGARGALSESDNKIIDMYPTFVAQSTALWSQETVAPGDLVWVDWGNRQNWTDPVYIRPVKESVGEAQGGGGSGGKDSHGNCSGGSYSAKPAPGDSTGGSNAPVKPYSGLPRLKRTPKPKGEPKLVTEENVDPTVKGWWEKAMKILPPGQSWVGKNKNNGAKDPKHKHGSRSTIIWYSNNVDLKQPWELIYFFHGLKEFSAKSLEKQIAKQIKKTASEGRNFVLVAPELPWSARGTPTTRQKLGFDSTSEAGGNFKLFHVDVLKQIKQMSGAGTTPAFISIFAHSAGGSALGRIADDGGLAAVGPNRVFGSDCDYGWYPGGVYKLVWNKYVKDQKNVWFTMMTTKNGKPRKNAEILVKDKGNDLKGRPVYHIPTGKNHTWCGENCINIVADEHKKRAEDKDKKDANEAAQGPPNDEEGEENQAVEDKAAQDQSEAQTGKPKEIPKKDSTGTPPPVDKPASAPSQISKESSTSKKPNWKTAPAVEYQENRVKVKDYGGSLVGGAAKKLLEVVEPGVKLHKLAAVRYRAFKKAAIAAGFPEFKISSGWRRHRWKSRAHYEKMMIAEYGSVASGQKKRAYASPHELGLALDVKAHGVYASEKGSKTIPKQKQTPLFAWMKENAHKFGLTPYKYEPWHWEARIPRDSYASGEEFTKDLAVKVTHDRGSQLPSGPSSGGSRSASGGGGGGGSGGARCVSTGGGGGHGGGPPGPYNPGKPFPVSGGGSLGSKLKAGPPPKDAEFWGDPKRNMKELTLFVLHETAGWPNSTSTLKNNLKRREAKKCVHFWGAVNGDIVQTARPEQIVWHANCTNDWSCGIEVCGFANAKGDYAATWERRIAMGMHTITHNGKGDINVEPGKVVASGVIYGAQHLSTPQQCESAWKLILWLAKSPPAIGADVKWRKGGQSGTPVIKIPISFPCGLEGDKFWWSKWNGGPTRDHHSATKWFSKHRPQGITSHARIHTHADGMPLEYYCLARAKGLSAKNAYYAMVGALCSGNKVSGKGAWTPQPNSTMVAIGKRKFKAAWFTQKTSKWVGKKKWKELAAANPQWFAKPEWHAKAGTKGYA